MACPDENPGASLIIALCVCVALSIFILPVASPIRGARLAEDLLPSLYVLSVLAVIMYA